MIDIIWGSAREKPVSSKSLADELSSIAGLSGYLYLGYPVIGSPTGPIKFDALLVSDTAGLVGFDLVEGTELGDFQSRQDDIASMLDVRLKPHAGLKDKRALKFEIGVVTYAPAKSVIPTVEDPYVISNRNSLKETINAFKWQCDDAVFKNLLAAIQVVTSIRAGKLKREPKKKDSRGARLKRVEESIANLDQHQSQAVIETVEGVQRIRGLAGSGKTIVLALKVAYLHTQNPEWRIAVTFNTRSLKEQFKRLINNFTIEQTGAEPDWENIDILNAWGAPGDSEREGIYHKYCRTQEIGFYDFSSAKLKFGDGKEFSGACGEAIKAKQSVTQVYDLLLVDEAQDLPAEFLRLCFGFLKEPKRLVYAYDELQSLTGSSVLPPEELFGVDAEGNPYVLLNTEEGATPKQDIILEKCYRNSRPLLATAHALGFGIYREKGLVQFFDQDNLWIDVGYTVEEGELRGGENVVLARSPDSSPLFLEEHSPVDDLIKFHRFNNTKEQTNFLVESIINDIQEEELRPEDIVVINPNPLTTKREVGAARDLLFSRSSINSELAGVSTSVDVFSKSGSVTFTGVFRAKGNEAGMVYIINADDSFVGWNKSATALERNRLFTAITRSKAWVRVLGIGKNMDGLIEEWDALRKNEYKLKFRYPTKEEKMELHLINKELVGAKRGKHRKIKAQRDMLIEAAERGDIDVDSLISDLQKIQKPRSKK
ncbi:MAG: ATP-binding domain-containing protein [Gallionellaceae bacterium]|nr:ATP-binding domain-containing protein [Gallionellaceae bacterium]